MKIAEGQRVVSSQGASVAAAAGVQGGAVAGDASRADRVSLSGPVGASPAVDQVRAGRADRQRAVAASVEAGGYRPDEGRVATRIVEEAELTAKLRALLG